MTTPERLRRRQRIEGALLIIIAIMMLIQAYYFNKQAQNQRDCLTRNLHNFSVTLGIRGELQGQDSNATRRVISTVAKAKTEVAVATALQHYLDDQHAIQTERSKHPIPPLPTGACTLG